jgi:PAS domain S-box-containing protein
MLDGFALHEIICDDTGRPVDYRFISVNPAFERLTGLRATDVIGRTVLEVMPGTEPAWIERYGRVALTGEGIEFEDYSGVLQRHFQITAFCYKPGQFATVFIDITARKQAEASLRASAETYRSILNASPDDITITDLEGRIFMVSPAALSMFGIGAEEVAQRHSILEFIVPEDRARALATLAQKFQGVKTGPTEYRGLHRDGHVFDIEVNSEFIQDAEGKPSSIVFVVRDVTERKRADNLIRASLREKESLLKEVHHRVKNNLQVISSLLRLEAGRSEHGATKSVLQEMQGRIRSMALLHETLYRTDNFGEIDLAFYFKQLAAQVFRSLGSRSGAIALQLNLTPVQMEIDRAIPCGLIANELLSNSLKHGFPDGGTGEVRIELQPVEGERRFRLVVSDTGVGLPADFELRQTQSLGLQLVSDLVGQIDGTLEIGRGPGAVFSVTFNSVAVAPVADKRPSPPSQHPFPAS